MSSDIYTMEYPKDGALQEAVKAGDIKAVGKHYHQQLLGILEANEIPPQVIVALSDDQILVGSVDAPTHEERHHLSLVTGRSFLQHFDQEPISCLVMMTAGVSTSADSGLKPNDDPKREYVAVTNTVNLKPFHSATNFDEYLEAYNNWDSRVWFDQHHEGLVIKTVWDGAAIVPSGDEREIGPDDKDVCRFENPNLAQCFIGISGNFAVVRSISEGKSKQEIDEQLASFFLERGMQADLPIKTRLLLLAQTFKSQQEPTKLNDSISVSDLSDHSIDVLECFGIQAPSILNTYSTELEDILYDLLAMNKRLSLEVNELKKFKEQMIASITTVTANRS